MARHAAAERIRLKDALPRLKIYMGKSSFYGSREEPGPRWTKIDDLGLLSGEKGITLDARKFEAWLKELAGPPATEPHPISRRLGTSESTRRYGDKVSDLCAAHERGDLTDEQFKRALESLEEDPE